jgi:hypothetical protein
MKPAHPLILSLASLLLIGVVARGHAGGLGSSPQRVHYVQIADDDLVVRRPTVSFLEVIALLLAAVGCFFGVAAFVEAKTAQRLIHDMKQHHPDC